MPSDRAGVLFDVDGTLVDTTYIHAVCWAEAMRQHGHEIATSIIHSKIGMSGDKLLEDLLGADRDTSEDDALTDAHKTLYRQSWGRLTTTPGAAELVRACSARGLQVVLASSASSEELDMLRETIDADDAIDEATSSSDTEGGKPDPDIVETSLDRAKLTADRAVFVGDAVWDGMAANRAGVDFIGLTCGGTPAVDLREAGAVEVYDDPAELLEKLDTSRIGKLGQV